MAVSAESPAIGNAGLDRLGAFLREELAPYPGRTAAVARMATACIVTMLAVMIFKLPNGFLAVFYALAISREDPRPTVRNGFAIVLGNLAGLALALAGIILFIDDPLLHFLFVVGTFFVAFFLHPYAGESQHGLRFQHHLSCCVFGEHNLGAPQSAQAGH